MAVRAQRQGTQYRSGYGHWIQRGQAIPAAEGILYLTVMTSAAPAPSPHFTFVLGWHHRWRAARHNNGPQEFALFSLLGEQKIDTDAPDARTAGIIPASATAVAVTSFHLGLRHLCVHQPSAMHAPPSPRPRPSQIIQSSAVSTKKLDEQMPPESWTGQ